MARGRAVSTADCASVTPPRDVLSAVERGFDCRPLRGSARGLTLEVDGRSVEGVLKERGEAREHAVLDLHRRWLERAEPGAALDTRPPRLGIGKRQVPGIVDRDARRDPLRMGHVARAGLALRQRPERRHVAAARIVVAQAYPPVFPPPGLT